MCSCYKLLESVVKNTNTRLLDIDLGLRICEVSLNDKHLPPSTCSSRDKVTQGQIFSWLSLKYNVTDINIPTNLKIQYCEQFIQFLQISAVAGRISDLLRIKWLGNDCTVNFYERAKVIDNVNGKANPLRNKLILENSQPSLFYSSAFFSTVLLSK